MKYAIPSTAPAHMVDLERARLLLGDEAIGLSDTDITAIARHADAVARVVVEAYLAQSASTRAA